MEIPAFKRIPRHIGIIPDGNRRWAVSRGMGKEDGYAYGIEPGEKFCELCVHLGVEEVTLYGFTQDNNKRPQEQRQAFQEACIESVRRLSRRDAVLRVVGDDASPMFPEELKAYTKRTTFGRGLLKINFLVNYDWHWDLSQSLKTKGSAGERSRKNFIECIGSSDVSRIDLVIRWGGRRRLSGLLPVQSVYSDFYILDELWPDYKPEHVFEALRWYERQDITLGG